MVMTSSLNSLELPQMVLLKLILLEGQKANSFFKAHHPSTEKPKALVEFEPRIEPELGTGDSHSTSTPLSRKEQI